MKVIKSGQYGDWGKPPAGKRLACPCCRAELEVEENEPNAVPTEQGTGSSGVIRQGWDIPCPECRRKVFVERALANVPA